jgi:Domain of unknown function (DUF4282)
MTSQGYGQSRPEYGPAPGQQGEAPMFAAAVQPGAARQYSDGRGFVAALFDFEFTSFVTTKVVKIVYVLIMVGLGLSALGMDIMTFTFAGPLPGLVMLVIATPLYFFVYLALWRMVLEAAVVFYRMADDLRAIRERGFR